MCVVIFLPAHRGFSLQAGAGWEELACIVAISTRCWSVRWLEQRGQAELPSNQCSQDHGMDEMALEGRAAMPTGVQPTPPPSSPYSAIAHHRRCQTVRLSDWLWEMPACPCFWFLVDIWFW